MCRMLLVTGQFDARLFVDAVKAMSSGACALHEYTGDRHDDGWGAAALVQRPDGTSDTDAAVVVRSARPISECPLTEQVAAQPCRALAIHARRASRATQRGLDFTHPIDTRIGTERGWFFHNGFYSGVHNAARSPESVWDSEELLWWLAPAFDVEDWRHALHEQLSRLPNGTTAANCMFLTPTRAVVCNWFDAGTGATKYYTMHQLTTPTMMAISSEPFDVPGAGRWTSLGRSAIVEWRARDSR